MSSLGKTNPFNRSFKKNKTAEINCFTYSKLKYFFSSDGYDSTDVEYKWWDPTRKEFLNVKIYSKDMQNYHVTEAIKSKNRTIYNHGKGDVTSIFLIDVTC